MSDPCEDICDAIVAYLNAAIDVDPNPFEPVTLVASKPADPLAQLTLEFPTIQVFLVPYSDSENKIGRPKFLEEHQVSVWVIRKIQDAWTRERMSGVVRQVVEYLRGVKMANYTYSEAITSVKFDLTQLHEKQQFLSITQFRYAGIR